MEAPLTFQENTFRSNMDALAVRQPDAFRRLAALSAPPSAFIVRGRDGSTVVRLGATASEIRWLGGSSMPNVSAPALLAGFSDRGTNVVLPAIGTGHEARILADRLPDHCAVFVCESEWMLIAAALAVVDLATPIRDGRIVLIGGDVEPGLVEFFRAHPGYLFPAQLHPLPQLTDIELAERRSAIERAGRQVYDVHQEIREELVRKASRLSSGPDADRPSILIVSTDAVASSFEFAAQLEHACAALGWPAAVSLSDAPDRCNPIARLSAVVEHAPSLVLFLNCTPGDLLNRISAPIPAACWFFDSPVLGGGAFEGLSQCRHILAESTKVREKLLERGAKPECVRVLERGIDPPQEDSPGQGEGEAIEVLDAVVLCDGRDITTAGSGIGLESHRRLWERMADLIAQAARRGERPRGAALLASAERETGFRLSEDALRNRFEALAEDRLVKTVMARTMIEELERQPRTGLWGAGWDHDPRLKAVHRGGIPRLGGRYRLYRGARLVVLPYTDSAAVQYAFEAISAGTCPVIQGPEAEVIAAYPRTGGILAELPSFATPSQLRRQLARLLRDDEGRERLVEELRTRVTSQHGLAHRLLTIRDCVLKQDAWANPDLTVS